MQKHTVFLLVFFLLFSVSIVKADVQVSRQVEDADTVMSIVESGVATNDILAVVESLPDGILFREPGAGWEFPDIGEFITPAINFFNETVVWLLAKTIPQKIGSFSVTSSIPNSFWYLRNEQTPINQYTKFKGKWALKSGTEGRTEGYSTIPAEPEPFTMFPIYQGTGTGISDEDEFPKYMYDESGNLAEIKYDTSSGYGIEGIRYYYDAAGNLLAEKKAIRLDSKKRYFYITLYSYDSNGNMVSYSSPTEQTNYVYDQNNSLKSMTTNGATTTYDYDDKGRVTCINCGDRASGLAEIYSYDENDSVVEYALGSAMVKQEFDESGRLSKIRDESGMEAIYSYDPTTGALTSITDSGFFGQNYTFNQCGTADNYTYDDNCNLLEDDIYTYEYSEGRLARKTDKGTGEAISYIYTQDDFLGKVIYQDGSADWHFYDSEGLFKIIDRFGIVFYRSPDESGMVTEDEFLIMVGDGNGDKKITSVDFFAALEEGNTGKIITIIYNWVAGGEIEPECAETDKQYYSCPDGSGYIVACHCPSGEWACSSNPQSRCLDTDKSGEVSVSELNTYITVWLRGFTSAENVVNAVNKFAETNQIPAEPTCSDGIKNGDEAGIDCGGSCPAPCTETSCIDGVDNDKDGKTDCVDEDCSADQACAITTTETICDDNIDDDGDGMTDCEDEDCLTDHVCTAPLWDVEGPWG